MNPEHTVLSVLLVEDNDLVLSVLSEILESLGCIVRAVPSVEEARAAIVTEQFDIILSDNDLPQKNQGMTFLQDAEMAQGRAVRWLMSGGNEPSGHNAHKFFSKPIERHELDPCIQKVRASLT